MQKRLKPTAVTNMLKSGDFPSPASAEHIGSSLKRRGWVDVGTNEEVVKEQTEDIKSLWIDMHDNLVFIQV